MNHPAMTPSIRITRFELYPSTEPQGYVVGFTCDHHASSRYFDTLVSMADASGKTDEEIAALAWDVLKSQYDAWFCECRCKSPLIGSTWTPPGMVAQEENVPVVSDPVVEQSIEPTVPDPIVSESATEPAVTDPVVVDETGP